MFEQAIEEKREKMKYLAKRYGMTAEVTINCSQELDKLLNVILFSQVESFIPNQQKHARQKTKVTT